MKKPLIHKQLEFPNQEMPGNLVSSSISRSNTEAFITEVYEAEACFIKVATNPISQNEHTFLTALSHSPYFPNSLSFNEKKTVAEVHIEKIVGESFFYVNCIPSFWKEANIVLFIEHCINILILLVENDVCHRDVRPKNILIEKVNNQYIPRLIDFGWATTIHDESAILPIGLGSAFKWKGDGFSDAHSMGKSLNAYLNMFDFSKPIINKLLKISSADYQDKAQLLAHLQELKSNYNANLPKLAFSDKIKLLIKKWQILILIKAVLGKKGIAFLKKYLKGL